MSASEVTAPLPDLPPLACLDCGFPYPDFPIDTTLPDEQWRMIHDSEGGILCASCMVKRASKLQGIIAARMRLEFANQSDGLPPEPEWLRQYFGPGRDGILEYIDALRAKAQELQEQIHQVEDTLGVPDTRSKTLIGKVNVALDRMQKEISIEHAGRKQAEAALAAALEREKAAREEVRAEIIALIDRMYDGSDHLIEPTRIKMAIRVAIEPIKS